MRIAIIIWVRDTLGLPLKVLIRRSPALKEKNRLILLQISNYMRSLVVPLLRVLLMLFISSAAQGALTNKNQTNDYLSDQIGNLSGMQEDLNQMLSNTKNQIKANDGNSPEGLDFITDQSASELNMHTQDLQSVRASDLDARGRDTLQDKEDIRDLHIDYSKPFNKRYKQSAKRLVKHYISQLEPLFSELEEIGINCDLEKGPTNIEPGMQERDESLIIENEEYNQEFCEQLNNQYSCLSTLHLTCKEEGLLWSAPVEKELILDGLDVYYHHRNWLYEEKKRRKLWGGLTERYVNYRISSNSDVVNSIRNFIANKEGYSRDEIGNDLDITSEGKRLVIARNRYASEIYKIKYRISSSRRVCHSWLEEWVDRCVLR